MERERIDDTDDLDGVAELKCFMKAFRDSLFIDDAVRNNISAEISQALSERFHEQLILGNGMDNSIRNTLEYFGEPEALAAQFNRIYRPGIDISAAVTYLRGKKVLLAAVISVLLMAFIL